LAFTIRWFILGAVSIILWFSAFLLAMLKNLFLSIPYYIFLISYLFLLLIGIAGSQMAKIYYEMKEAEENKYE
jgi:tetrahydromethanopterin S-methyltransferase subunit E